MPKDSKSSNGDSETPELLRDLLITQLSIAGLSNDAIQEIAKCNRTRIADIAKHVRAAQRNNDEKKNKTIVIQSSKRSKR